MNETPTTQENGTRGGQMALAVDFHDSLLSDAMDARYCTSVPIQEDIYDYE